MTPVERAAAVYAREWCAGTFREDLEAHLLHGYVHSTPQAFVMARPVDSRAAEDLVLDPWHAFPREAQDAWLIWLAAGDLGPFLRLFPYTLPRLGWQKRNRLRWHEVGGGKSQQRVMARLGRMTGSE